MSAPLPTNALTLSMLLTCPSELPWLAPLLDGSGHALVATLEPAADRAHIVPAPTASTISARTTADLT